ncbi:hypothetical protein [Exiguobacterium acetylicum]|uniref:hypothetical protein n=1 Tax=Exiguobacterium acetylicum TaxID=41170 RepID=UPI001CA5F73B|nr:hypothetical protein [Exiguobacterium acetylicum]QZY88634.1 hypothetical protein K7G97_17415 [Exiguobacterium acetylicum]
MNLYNRLECTVMSYPPKSYKIRPLYLVQFHSIYEVLNKNKPYLVDYYLDREIGRDGRIHLSRFSFNELFIDMINQLENALQKNDYDDLLLKIGMNERTSKLSKIYNNMPSTPTKLTPCQFRISNDTILQVKELKRETLGEVVEQSISHYLTLLTEIEWQLVNEVFKRFLTSGKLFN